MCLADAIAGHLCHVPTSEGGVRHKGEAAHSQLQEADEAGPVVTGRLARAAVEATDDAHGGTE